MKEKVEEKKFKSGELKKIVFAALGVSLVIGGTVYFSPNFPIILGALVKVIEELKGIKISKRKVQRVLKELEKREIIQIERKGDQISVTVQDRSNTEILKYSLKEIINLKKKKNWEGKWFLVIFDVPEKQRNKRDYLRKLLYEIGFFPYQQSVYVYPYECKKEIELIKKIVEGGQYVNYIIAESLEGEDKLKSHFKIVN